MPESPVHLLRDAKKRGARLAMVSLYDAPTAVLSCDAGADLLLVGDSMGNVVLGHDNTVPVTMADVLHHTRAVVRGVRASTRPNVPVFADLPFGSYATVEMAVQNGVELMRAGAHGVKLEGGHETALRAIRVLVESGAPVMGHLGYTPQSALQFESVVQGKTNESASRLIHEAHCLQDAGCCGMVLEVMPNEVAARITQELAISTIGIGAGPHCDGQVLVWHDLVGFSPGKFRFVERYANARETLGAATRSFVEEVQSGAFPTAEHGWPMGEAQLEAWRNAEPQTPNDAGQKGS
jgi:3-methyl-2-oxobutanoate hydroxymethyltransferase